MDCISLNWHIPFNEAVLAYIGLKYWNNFQPKSPKVHSETKTSEAWLLSLSFCKKNEMANYFIESFGGCRIAVNAQGRARTRLPACVRCACGMCEACARTHFRHDEDDGMVITETLSLFVRQLLFCAVESRTRHTRTCLTQPRKENGPKMKRRDACLCCALL